MRLVTAHVELAKAEFTDILDEVKRFAIAGGIALGLLFFLGMLVPVGLTLFVGEWLFGSIGWGVLHGVEISVAIGVAAVLAAFGLPARKIGRAFLAALVIGIVVGIVFAFNLPHQGWSRLGDNLFAGIGPDVRPLVTAVVGSIVGLAVLGLVLGLVIGRTRGAAIGGFFLGLVLGLPFGALTAISFGGQPGAGLGLAIGILAWIIGLIVAVVRHGIDLDALKKRLWPQQTIDTTKETIEWVRAQTPLGPKS